MILLCFYTVFLRVLVTDWSDIISGCRSWAFRQSILFETFNPTTRCVILLCNTRMIILSIQYYVYSYWYCDVNILMSICCGSSSQGERLLTLGRVPQFSAQPQNDLSWQSCLDKCWVSSDSERVWATRFFRRPKLMPSINIGDLRAIGGIASFLGRTFLA